MVALFLPIPFHRLPELVVTERAYPHNVFSSFSGRRIKPRKQASYRISHGFKFVVSPFVSIFHAIENCRGMTRDVGKITQGRGNLSHA